MEFDPDEITYRDLLEVFWEGHNPTWKPYGRQYMSAVFYANPRQKRLARTSRSHRSETSHKSIHTKILPLETFHRAEEEHQKHALRSWKDVLAELKAVYPKTKDLVDSTVATRVNGYLAGNGSLRVLREQIDSFGLSSRTRKRLLSLAQR